jgi:hypothetical protein
VLQQCVDVGWFVLLLTVSGTPTHRLVSKGGVPQGGEMLRSLKRISDPTRVTMGCGDACPIYLGRRYLDWEFDDPAGLPLARVREIRDDIESRVRELRDCH